MFGPYYQKGNRTIYTAGDEKEAKPIGVTPEAYTAHVFLRIKLYSILLFNLGYALIQVKPTARHYRDYLTEKASGQIGSGMYSGCVKQDAAHFINTTFEHSVFCQDNPAQRTQAQNELLLDIYKISTATEQMDKSLNVGPDKVIDNFQKNYKNGFLDHVETQGKLPDVQQVVGEIFSQVHQELIAYSGRKKLEDATGLKAEATMDVIYALSVTDPPVNDAGQRQWHSQQQSQAAQDVINELKEFEKKWNG